MRLAIFLGLRLSAEDDFLRSSRAILIAVELAEASALSGIELGFGQLAIGIGVELQKAEAPVSTSARHLRYSRTREREKRDGKKDNGFHRFGSPGALSRRRHGI
jgi:hypothetical protein